MCVCITLSGLINSNKSKGSESVMIKAMHRAASPRNNNNHHLDKV